MTSTLSSDSSNTTAHYTSNVDKENEFKQVLNELSMIQISCQM